MKKLKIPMMLLFLMGFLIIGACEKEAVIPPGEDPPPNTLQDTALEEDQFLENHEDPDKIKRQSDPSL